MCGKRRSGIVRGPKPNKLAMDDFDVGELLADSEGRVDGSRVINEDLRKFLKGRQRGGQSVLTVFGEHGYTDHISER